MTPYYKLGERILQRFRVAHIRKDIPIGAKLLDVGCGNGALLYQLAPVLNLGVGLDQRVVEQINGHIHFKPWLADSVIPFPDSFFDAVTMTAVLEHLNNPQFVLGECYRVLCPGGRLLLTTPSPYAKPVLEFLAFQLNMLSRQEIADHVHYWSCAEIKRLLLNVGFTETTTIVRYFQAGFNIFALTVK